MSLIIILLIREFFTLGLVDGFPLESEWQQVSSGFHEFSQYPDQSQWCSLDGLYSSSFFFKKN